MNLRSLETLVEIAAQGSFIKAAESRHMTLSTVSMQMKVLEEELNAQLFDRSFRPPKLTPMGRKVAYEARDVLKASRRLQETCKLSDELVGDFRIGFVLTSSIRLLPDFLAHAGKTAPNARFHVETGLSDDLSARVVAGNLDAAVVTGGNLPVSLETHLLRREELVYCLPKPVADWSIERLMAEKPFIHFMPQTGIGQLIARHIEEKGYSPASVIVLDSVEAVAECVRADVGFAILPKPHIRRNTEEDHLILRSIEEKTLMRELVLAFQRQGIVADKVERLVELFEPMGD